MENKKHGACYLCQENNYVVIKKIDKKPERETNYLIPEADYLRFICQCSHCGVYFNQDNGLINNEFYYGFYNKAIDPTGVKRRFDKIIQFPFEASDNKNRVLRIINFLYQKDRTPNGLEVLDIGSGTGVFLYEMAKFGCRLSCLDPDSDSVHHISSVLLLEDAFNCKIEALDTNKKFDFIALNKVLEHLETPVQTLSSLSTFLNEDGLIYIELPHAHGAISTGDIKNQSEFFIEHHTIFTESSFKYLIEKSNYSLLHMDNLIDPSGKFSIYAFIQKKQ